MNRSTTRIGLAAVAILAARPGAADLKVLEPYGGIFSGRTLLGSPDDHRPKDALQGQVSRRPDPSGRFVFSPLFAHTDDTGGDVSTLGATIGYASVRNPQHPWQLQASAFNNHVKVAGVGRSDVRQLELVGKYVLSQPVQPDRPVVSLVGRWSDYDELGDRSDLLLAADQRLGPRTFGTANVGWGRNQCDGVPTTHGLVAGMGVTYLLSPRLSISADYTFRNSADGADLWTVAASYAIDRNSLVRIGGGRNGTLGENRGLVFVSYVLKFDTK